MSASRLVSPIHLPDCEANVSEQTMMWRKAGNMECRSKARFEINGKKLCQKHAQAFALRVLLGEEIPW